VLALLELEAGKEFVPVDERDRRELAFTATRPAVFVAGWFGVELG
jgi:hypothetical protein